MRSILQRFALSVLPLLSLSVASAQEAGENSVCFNDRSDPESRIISCTKLLLQKGADPTERARLHSNRGVAFGQSGEIKRAIADFDQALEVKANDPAILNNRCYFLAVAGELKKALADCNAALKLQAPTVAMLDSRGYAHLRSGNIDPALKDYDEALKLDPTYPSALWGRGLILLRQGKFNDAAQDFDAAKRTNPHIERDMAAVGLKRPRPVANAPR